MRKVASRPTTTPTVAVLSSRWKMLTIHVVAKSPHSAKTSPCAKLISCRMPYTSV